MNEKDAIASRPDPLQGRLNVFQKTMLDWNDLHPYNAVHVVKILSPPDFEKLKHAIESTLGFHGLTNLTLDRKRGTFHFAGGHANIALETIEGTKAQKILRAQIEKEVNTGFNIAETFLPFRFFTLPEKESFYLGAVYFHPVADAVSVISLLRQICLTFTDNNRGGTKPFSVARTRRPFQPATLVRKLVDFFGQLRQHQRSVRVAYRDITDGHNRFEYFSLGPEILRNLAAAAKHWDVTINDIFLAIVLLCCSPFALNRFRERPRSRLEIGCIVNTRNDLKLADPLAWGLFLGSFVVTHETPEGIGLRDLAQDVRRQTLVIKRKKNYVGVSPELVLGRFLLSFFSTKYRTKLYQKHYPLWGGVTNMNLNSLWPQPSSAPAVDFFRGVSTGPVTPLVLSATTVGNALNIGLTFRSTTFTDAHIQQIKKHFMTLLEQLNPRA